MTTQQRSPQKYKRSETMTRDKTYRVGIIGCGRKGHGHARGYEGNPRTELVAAAEPDHANLEIFLDRFPVKGYGDYRELLMQEDLDIAAPILPVKPNPQVVIDCAAAGVKAIYCEKPMAAGASVSPLAPFFLPAAPFLAASFFPPAPPPFTILRTPPTTYSYSVLVANCARS